jgi:site-specific DNA recombinase
MRKQLTEYVPVEERDPSHVRAVIVARKSKNGVESDVQSQVEASQQFIEQRGWTLVADPYQYAEIGKSGRYNVVRKMLEAVLLLAQQKKVDVIVAREPERLSRTSERRAFYIELCKSWGVEWRFANLQPDGKLPDTLEGKLMGMVTELYGELEAARIAERTAPGQERRYAAGLPHGGRYGPPYGYKWRPKALDEKTYSAYLEDPEKAAIVREIYTRFATDESTTGRSLAAELNARGIPSPGGKSWSRSHLIAMIRNPIYCGQGRRKRWQRV